ncbi:MAG TPA: type IV pilus twitching motility protein PilT [Bdellovibrionota bacterium]|jgi:twitching motility protein PilT
MAQVTLQQLLKAMVEQDASDLHVTVGSPPQLRIGGIMSKVKTEVMSSTDTKNLCYGVLTDAQKAEFEEKLEIDVSFGIKNLARFRGNIFMQRGSVAGVFRRIPFDIPDMNALGLPVVIKDMVKAPNGLILVTGPTGSGKSTTLASIIDYLNNNERGHIITLEDPIEFIHPHKNCVINQREIGTDTFSFTAALKRVLRQDPDYILVGELRDQETIEMALSAAETGHLVFGTLHTNSALQTINRLVDVFPPDKQNSVRHLLSFVLIGVISQNLLLRRTGRSRLLVMEIMRTNNAIRNLIREEKLEQVYSAMQVGQAESGMFTMNQSLSKLVADGSITEEAALEASTVPDELVRMLTGMAGQKKK